MSDSRILSLPSNCVPHGVNIVSLQLEFGSSHPNFPVAMAVATLWLWPIRGWLWPPRLWRGHQNLKAQPTYYIETAKISYLRRARLAVATRISPWPWPQPPGGYGQFAGGYSQFLAKTTKCITLCLSFRAKPYYRLQTTNQRTAYCFA